MPLVSIIIPYADYHTTIVAQAIAAARAQSLPCEVIPFEDKNGYGAGYARNRGVALSDTPFVAFCDADDVLREDAIELMVASYTQQGTYIYCDNIQGDSLHQTNDKGYYDGTWWHTVTTLIPRAAFDAVGGFNEDLPALEDMDLFLRLQAHGVCGVRCPHPLLKYTAGGQRSAGFTQHPDYRTLRQSIFQRWSNAAMCNCGTAVTGQVPDGKQDGDILVQTLYTPMQKTGPATGRLYARPRGTTNYQIYVDPHDVQIRPDWWQPIRVINQDAQPKVDDVVAMAKAAMGS